MYPSAKLAYASGLLTAVLACTSLSGSDSGFTSAVGSLEADVLACSTSGPQGRLSLAGIAASSCNQAQRTYAALNTAQIAGLAARCHCKTAYYDHAKTLGDVDLWTNCVGPVNVLIVTSARAANDYQLSHAKEIFASCNVCTDAQFKPIEDSLEQVQTVLDFVLDWRGKLLETETDMLKEGVQAVVVSAAVGNGVPNGAPSPSVDFIVSTIKRGSSGTADSQELRSRQANGTGAVAPSITDLLSVQVKLHMVPVNVTSAVLEGQLKQVYTSSTFASNLTVWNANLTGTSYSRIYGNQSATTTPSGSAPLASPTTGSGTNLIPTTTLLAFSFVYCLLSTL